MDKTGIAGLQGARGQQGFAEPGNLKDFGVSGGHQHSPAQLAGTAQPSPGCDGPAQSRHGQKPSRDGREEGETLLCQSESLPKGVTKLCQWNSRGQTPQLSPCGCPCTARGGWLQHRLCSGAQLRWAGILVF